MKKQLRTNPAIKVLAVILVLITMAGGFWATIFTLSQWDDIWTGGDYFNSSGYSHRLYDRTMQVQNLVTLMQDRQWDSGKLSYTNQRWLEQLQQNLTEENTNFRVRVLDNETGELVYTNLSGAATKEPMVRQD